MSRTRTFLILWSVVDSALSAAYQTPFTSYPIYFLTPTFYPQQDQNFAPAPRDNGFFPQPSPNPSSQIAGSIVKCLTLEEKKCLSLNKVPIDGKCYTVGTPGPCGTLEIVVVDKKELQEFNVLRGACRSLNICDNFNKELMTYDQLCYDLQAIKKFVCAPEKNLRLRKNIFGEGECESLTKENYVEEETGLKTPLQEQQCYAPDLSFEFSYEPRSDQSRFPQLSVAHALWNVSVSCDAEERACLARGEVLVGRGAPGALADPAGCHALLTRGPCPPGAWLVLDRRTLEEERRLAPVCDWARCAPSSVFLAETQHCVSLWELQHERCAGEDVVFDVFGEAHCTRFTTQAELLTLPSHEQGDECRLKIERSHG